MSVMFPQDTDDFDGFVEWEADMAKLVNGCLVVFVVGVLVLILLAWGIFR